ncbi:hypothetical protein [Nocardioides sp. L-11A]|uniref:hypothetical protein n=1 Tax=Nocardioides sp. L-11A TaxID=3043848 RepID=UPI00249AC85D|nr:hypothetical protein QJ852_17020 [Nocardioides sp. L-11A]
MSVKRRLAGLAAVLSAGAAVSLQVIAPVGATTTPGAWNLASNGVDASGKTFTGSLTLTWTMTFNGTPFTVNCTIVGGIAHTAPDPTPHAWELDTMVIQVDPSDSLAPGAGTCTESITSGAVHISTTPGSLWTLSVETPDAPPANPAHYTAALTGYLSVPANSVTAVAVKLPGINNNLTPPCKLVGPTGTAPLQVPGSYTGSTGVATMTGGGVSMTLDNTGCPRAGTAAVLQSASATLWEVGATSNHPDLIYVP